MSLVRLEAKGFLCHTAFLHWASAFEMCLFACAYEMCYTLSLLLRLHRVAWVVGGDGWSRAMKYETT
jgi:hypothetical protein